VPAIRNPGDLLNKAADPDAMQVSADAKHEKPAFGQQEPAIDQLGRIPLMLF
jgi:hypothetical protein